MPDSICPRAILLPISAQASRLVPQARCKSMPGVQRRQAALNDGLARQIEVPRMFDDGSESNIAKRLPLEVVLVDDA